MIRAVFFYSIILSVILVSVSVAANKTKYVVPRLGRPSQTADGGAFIEGTTTVPAKAWHAKLDTNYQYDVGMADNGSQVRFNAIWGFGVVKNLGLSVLLPVGVTRGSKDHSSVQKQHREISGMADGGAWLGDLGATVLYSMKDAQNGGLGLLFGITAFFPTGDNGRLLGEGWFSVQPFVSAAFQVFGSRLSLNLAYLAAPEHCYYLEETHSSGCLFEQDDQVTWRVGLRIPKKNDVAWSVEVEGAIGVLIEQGVWPTADHRPVIISGGLDFPIDRLHRLGFYGGLGLDRETAPNFLTGIRIIWQPHLPDEDGDGMSGAQDLCPVMKEDRDGFQDSDGCPDLDNDKDGFPDEEDACPLVKAAEFSDNGC